MRRGRRGKTIKRASVTIVECKDVEKKKIPLFDKSSSSAKITVHALQSARFCNNPFVMLAMIGCMLAKAAALRVYMIDENLVKMV